jgi:anti-sigma-K factor RskA
MTVPTGPGHDRWQDASGAYVLAAMEPEEAEAFALHLEACPACREEVAELTAVVHALPAAAPPVPAPAVVGERVMAEVRREAALLGEATRSARQPTPRHARRMAGIARRWRTPSLALATLLAGVVVGLAAAGAFGGGARTVPVTAAGAAGGAQGRLVLGDDAATLELDGLASPAHGRVYEVWLKPDGADPRPTRSLFVPRSDGSATVAVPASARDMQAVLVTAEPRGGSPAPTSAPVLSAVVGS